MNMPQSIRNKNTIWKNMNTAFFGLFFYRLFLEKSFFRFDFFENV